MLQNPLIQVTDVYKSFKNVKAVNGLTFQLGLGQFLALLGPNGAGKTTMVEMIEGIQKPDSGEIIIDSKKWKHHEEEIHRIIGISLQETQYVDKLTVRETLALFASFYHLNKKRIDEVIGIVGLEEKRKAYVVNLSGGQRQRLALGIALLNQPRILLLDEPTTGLDPTARREIWEILQELKRESGTALILTTHYMEEAEKLCDYIIIMDHGVILREGTIKQLLKKEQNKNIVEFTLLNGRKLSAADIKSSPFQIHWNDCLDKGSVELFKLDKELPVFLKFLDERGLQLNNLESRRTSLDDLFISLTGRHLHE
jgi:ABC-2 type transport system ATP-binding protein